MIPTRPVQRLAALTRDERSSLMDGVAEVQQRLGQQFSTTDFTVCVHDGPLAGQKSLTSMSMSSADIGRRRWYPDGHVARYTIAEPDHATLGSLATALREGA